LLLCRDVWINLANDDIGMSLQRLREEMAELINTESNLQLKRRQITEAGGFTSCATALSSRYCASRSQHSAIMIKTARVLGETRSAKRRHSSAFRR
jgi:hypothetical protein